MLQAAPLTASTQPQPGDLHLVLYAASAASLGHIHLTLCAGRGSRGRGQRTHDDATFFAATLCRLAAHIATYADAYVQAADQDA